jgi:hypothetical protein
MSSSEDHPAARDVADYVQRYAPELDPAAVHEFMAGHARPDDETDSHIAWTVRVLRERGEGGDGLRVDRVVDEMRRHDRVAEEMRRHDR